MNDFSIVESKPFRNFLFFAFFLTGSTGLMYQVLWSRLLVFSFGYTIHSISIVITAFMGGLAIGSFLGGILADRLRSVVMAYGLAEIGIGVIAIATYPLLTGLPYFIAEHRDSLSIPFYGFNLWTFLIAMAILLPPTILMGFTLPFLARALTRTGKSAAFDLGALYSVNTLGAALGSLVAGFFLIAYLGVYNTLITAASINIIIGILAILFVRSKRGQGASISVDPEASEDDPATPVTSILREPIFWAFGISGFAALACEIVWMRLFAPYLESSTYAFSLILCIFLLGIACGGWAGRKAGARTQNSVVGFGTCQVLIGFSTAIGLLLYYPFVGRFYSTLPDLGLLVKNPSIILEQSAWLFGLLILSTFFMGAGFPFVAQWVGCEFKRLGKRTGKLYAANTVGSIVGALAGGFFFIPAFGTRGSLVVITFLFILNGAYLLYLHRASTVWVRSKKMLAIPVVLLAGFVIVLNYLPDPNIMAISRAYPDHNMLAHREDPDVNVTVLRDKRSKTSRLLFINLKRVSGTGLHMTPWMAQLPLMMFDDGPPKRMLIIGLGIGHSFTSSLKHPGLKVDVAELVPGVAELFEELNPVGKEALQNERSNVVIADGRNYLLSAKEPYDVISIDPTPPLYGTGAVNLYTEDFFTIIMGKLSPKGILLLRVPGSADEKSVKLLVRTAMEVFPYVSLWEPTGSGYSIIASKAQYGRDKSALDALDRKVDEADFLTPERKKLLHKYRPNPLGTNEELFKYVKGVPVVTDDRPYLEFPLFLEDF